ncbi:MAG TPA: hypothetical protein VM182_16580 [Terriglobia bacterium]|nr:hypothetical protein [Terriglobia bacterium]
MAQLTFSQQPGAVDLADSTFDQDKPVTDVALKQLNQNAKFGMVRVEFFQGYYKNGETVVLPVSPVDGYAYARAELRYLWSVYSTRPATGATNGAANPPALGTEQIGGGGVDGVDVFTAYVEHKNATNPGRVHCEVIMGDGTNQTITSYGVLYATTVAERLSG